MGFDRITRSPDKMGGRPCIRGLRITVGTIVGHMAGGYSAEQVLEDFPLLELEDVHQALAYAAALVRGDVIELAAA